MSLPAGCPQCGSDGVAAGDLEGLCPQCLLSLALLGSPHAGNPFDVPTQYGAAPGHLLGDRYQIRELLGRGGMGEVYRAFDLKLRVDVALKSVRQGHAWDERAGDLLRSEVRSAREVVSPNVCRIFDLVDRDDQELLSMEYIDGETLGERIRQHGPLALEEAREIASQFLAGLAAIHAAGLVHRDFKPENVMITRAGRVVVMDFGVARAARDGASGTISGTPAYMAPEQARGDDVDARADVFSAGVVLAEMISVGGRDATAARQALWRRVRNTPPDVPEGPWSDVLPRALAPQPGARYGSADALARALEAVTLRLPGVEERRPYPGLAAFTEQDAEYFFGREVEVEAVWKKLKRPRLLGLIGPSGSGKSSFLRAGLVPTLPPSWKSVLATPGTHPFQALAQALVPQCADDTQALQALVRFEHADVAVAAVTRWRARHEHTVVVVDQFEELFTQNDAGTQAAFAQLLGRLVLEADTHVIVSLRDDFLIHCHGHEALAPMLSDLTLLGPLGASALRRALVQPALSCGYHFEDEALVQEMVEEVVSERGALPLLAFAASRLWDTRDRDKGILTRTTYREIGGVAGALAQHAEATLDRIGAERTPIVRELFRNLVTSLGTRAVRGRDDLLSVFAREASADVRHAAELVLNALVDARLLTTYERTGDAGERIQEIEIIHESLLTAWPRLVRWQTQDADGAQLRDQLRQAAELWHARSRPEDLLWSGVAYRDFALWRERYRGGLSATEAAFAEAARRRAGRRRTRRQVALATLLAAVALVAVAMTVLWRRSEVARQHAAAESLRAEAGKLEVLGERELQTYPTASLAYAIKSLELADTPSARLLALRVLQQAPTARIARVSEGHDRNATGPVDVSPTGEWVAWGGHDFVELLHRDGKRRILLEGYPPRGGVSVWPRFTPDGSALVGNRDGDVRIWAIPAGRELYRGHVEDGPSSLAMGTGAFVTLTRVGGTRVLDTWPLTAPSPQRVGDLAARALALTARAVAYAEGRAVYIRSVDDWTAAPRRVLEQPTDIVAIALAPDGTEVAATDEAGTIRVAPVDPRASGGSRVFATGEGLVDLRYDQARRWLTALAFGGGHPAMRVYDRAAPAGSDPLVLRKGDTNSGSFFAFDAGARWLVSTHGAEIAFWPLGDRRARVVRLPGPAPSLLFTSDGRQLVYLSIDRSVHALPLRPSDPPRVVYAAGPTSPLLIHMAGDPSSGRLALTGGGGRVVLVRSDGGTAEPLPGFPEQNLTGRAAFASNGRLLAAGLHGGPRGQKVIRVWDLDAGTSRVYGPLPGAGDKVDGGIVDVAFARPDRLIASVRGAGLVSVDLTTGATRVVIAGPVGEFVLRPDGRGGVALRKDRDMPEAGAWGAIRFDLDSGATQPLPHGADPTAIALDPSGALVATGDADGTIRISRVSGGEPHLLLGQEGAVYSLAFSPDGQWLAASGEASVIRIWPVPDVSKRPVHLLPWDSLITLLRNHTNLRAVPNDTSANGYMLEPGPFPGWASEPTW